MQPTHPLFPLRQLLNAQIAAMSPEERAESRESARRLMAMNPEERAAYLAEIRREAMAKYEQRQGEAKAKAKAEAKAKAKAKAKRKADPPVTEGSSPPES